MFLRAGARQQFLIPFPPSDLSISFFEERVNCPLKGQEGVPQSLLTWQLADVRALLARTSPCDHQNWEKEYLLTARPTGRMIRG
jgi:hypothetical protein